ncbi:MAG: ATP-binding cassette domain-containing protein [Eggerthellaceae bacterium]|nr:ATP-binding cassette domain-containing protein [Eggerthellaceae bacterium]
MGPKSENILEIRGLHKSSGDNEILKGLNLEIQEGELYGLVGKNSVGKTMLYRILFVLSFPNSGEIGFSNKSKNFFNFRAKIGYFLDYCFFTA